MEVNLQYKKFYHTILEQIKNGKLKNGEKLPTERALCGLYNISRTTVREALRHLENEGYIIRKQGSGNYVNIKPIHQNLIKLYTLRDMFSKQGIKHDTNILKFAISSSTEEVAKHLSITVDDEVIELFRLFLAADVPYTVEYTYLPRKIFPEITKDMITNDGLYNTLERLGKKPTSAVETIKTTKMDDEQKGYLNMSRKEIVIETNRVTKSDDVIIEYTKNIIRNNYFVYTVELK